MQLKMKDPVWAGAGELRMHMDCAGMRCPHTGTQDLSSARKYATVKMTAHHSKKKNSDGLTYSTSTSKEFVAYKNSLILDIFL